MKNKGEKVLIGNVVLPGESSEDFKKMLEGFIDARIDRRLSELASLK